MNISKNSWHYRLNSVIFKDHEIKANICPYFWQTILIMTITCFGLLGGIMVTSILSVPLWAWYFGIPVALGIAVGIIYLLIGYAVLSSGVCTGNSTLDNEIFTCEETPFCMVIREWIIAKHDKICPSINFF